MEAVTAGFMLGFSLILAIGAQNAFVLRQGLRRDHVFEVCLTCALSDALLIVVGVSGFAWIVQAAPWIAPGLRYGGAAFLIWYGAQNAYAAAYGQSALAATQKELPGTRKRVLLTCLALTWLNPHVYLDTVVLLGSVSTGYDNRIGFGAGATLASFVFFFGLGYGARLLDPVFRRPVAWQVLDGVVALTMWAIAARLLWQ